MRALFQRRGQPKNLRPDGHFRDDVPRAPAKTILPASVDGVFGHEPGLIIEIGEIGDVLVGDHHHVAALAAVAAVRPAPIDIFLPPNDTQPFPPSPAFTRILTLSTNMRVGYCQKRHAERGKRVDPETGLATQTSAMRS